MRNLARTSQFRSWFAGSKIVDAEGSPLVVFHGTKSSFEEFRSKNKNPDIGFHFGDISQAENCAGFNAHGLTCVGGNIVPVYLRITNPLYVRDVFGGKQNNIEAFACHVYAKGVVDEATRDRAVYADTIGNGWRTLIKALKKRGYDGLIYRNEYEGDRKGENLGYVVFDSGQIKSVFDGT